MLRRGVALGLALTGVLLHASGPRPAEPQTVTFTARDGVPVTGTLYLPEKQPAPAVVLLHMLSRSQRDWETTASRLSSAGIAALAIDFRRNGGPKAGAPGSGEAGGFSDLLLDAEAARGYLAARPEIAPGRVGMAGASIGATIAVLVAANDAAVQSIVLLSPSLEYRGLYMEPGLRKYASRPALLVASSEDPYALRSARQAVTMGDGPRELRVLSGAGHGTVMLARDPDLITAVVDWFLRTLL